MRSTCSGRPTCASEPGALLHARSLGVTVCPCVLVCNSMPVGACPGPHTRRGEGGRRPSRETGRGESVSVPDTCECGPDVVTVWKPGSQPGAVSGAHLCVPRCAGACAETGEGSQ